MASALPGSGKFGTPWERMQWEKLTAGELAAPAAFDEPPGPAADGLPLQAAAGQGQGGGGEEAAAFASAPADGTGIGFMLAVLRPGG